MLITAIEPITKDRHRVLLENGENFVLYKGEIRHLRLKEGLELSDKYYDSIMTVILPKRAKLRMMNLLNVKDYTEYQLSKKLLDAGYPRAIVDEALSYVKSFNYVDDLRYAKSFIASESGKRSRKEIELKLLQKGIHKDVTAEAFYAISGDSEEGADKTFDETEVIVKALKKKHFTGEESYEEKQKILAYFYRRGFNMDAVYRAMDNLT